MFLAFAEMRRARLRFALLGAAVGLLMFLVMFVQSITDSLVTQFIGGLKNQSAEVLVYGADARQNLEGSRVNPESIAAVRAIAGVARAEPFGEGAFTVRAGGDERAAVIFGYVLGGPGAPTTLIAGRMPTGAGEAVASAGDAPEGFAIGDTVRVVPGGASIRVVGRARDANYSVSPTLFVSYPSYVAARRAANPDARRVLPSAVAVSVAEDGDPDAVAAAINAHIDGVEALTRGAAVDRSPGVSAVRQSFSVVTLLFYIAIPLITGLFFVIITVQKAGALTLLRAIGARAATLVVALLIQVLIVLAAGTALGVAILFAADALMSDGAVGVSPKAGTLMVTVALVTLLSLVTSLVAVRRILRIDPVRAVTRSGAVE